MIALLVLGAAGLICVGALIGAAWTTQIMGGVSRRHAAERRRLNDGWRALAAARAARGEPVFCARCHQRLSQLGWRTAVPVHGDEEDDGT